MSVKVMDWVWHHSQEKGSARLVLLALADNAHDDGTGAYPSIDTLAHKAQLSRRNVQYLLREMAENGSVIIRDREGPKGVNVYDVVMQGGANFAREVQPSASGVQPSANGGAKAIAPNPEEEPSEEKSLTPNTLRRVLPPKGGFPPPEGFSEFHKILSDGIPGYKPTPSFWATVERYKTLDVVDEAHRMVVWFADHPNKRKGANSFILNWLKRAGQDLVRQTNDRRNENREQPSGQRDNPFAAYG